MGEPDAGRVIPKKAQDSHQGTRHPKQTQQANGTESRKDRDKHRLHDALRHEHNQKSYCDKKIYKP